MRSMADRRVVVVGLLAITCLASSVEAKTIVVDSYDAAVPAKPGRYLIDNVSDSAGGRAGALFRPVSATENLMTDALPVRHTSVSPTPLLAGFGPPGPLVDLYEEGRRAALNELHTRDAASIEDDASGTPPVQQGDFWTMLLVGAVLVAIQLRRKHRSLKQSLIAG
jgi:hypothetical protein